MESTGGFHVCVVAQDFGRYVAFYESLRFSATGQVALKDDPELQMQYLRYLCGGLNEIVKYQLKFLEARFFLDIGYLLSFHSDVDIPTNHLTSIQEVIL